MIEYINQYIENEISLTDEIVNKIQEKIDDLPI